VAISRKRGTNARRIPKAALVAGPLALVATATVVTAGVAASTPEPASRPVAAHRVSVDLTDRTAAVSRSSSRLDLARKVHDGVLIKRAYHVDMSRSAVAQAVRAAHERRWTTARLNLWSTPGTDAAHLGLVEAGKKVLLTGRHDMGRDEVVVAGRAGWVTAGYLDDSKPVVHRAVAPAAPAEGTSSTSSTTPTTTTTSGVSTAPCPDSSTESGLTSSAVMVYRAVCHAFPQITSYGGYDAHGEHASGRAIDVMTSDKALGDQIAAFLQSHASELGLYDIIWWDQIWTPERASEGWRDYGSHGSATADHMDHVHVSHVLTGRRESTVGGWQ
jgi:uncharacterized protein YraI